MRTIFVVKSSEKLTRASQTADQIVKLVVPDKADVTLAGINPQNPSSGTILRVYETRNNKKVQLAAIRNAVEFWDEAVAPEWMVQGEWKDFEAVIELATKEDEKGLWTPGGDVPKQAEKGLGTMNLIDDGGDF